MVVGRADESRTESNPERFFVEPPAIAPVTGGGAIRGIGEKFTANPVTGTGSLRIPIATSPGRAGFGPELALAYDSGAGNGPFGFGWSIELPAIARKTDKGLPRYRDGEESDVFVLSGAEDLVPAAAADLPRDGYRVRRYRPRIEGTFARIERWSHATDPTDVWWRVISRTNITTIYGASADSRIADPADPARIFRWLPDESYDDKGNSIVYTYAREDAAGVDVTRIHERHRGERTNRYLKRIRYGNRTPRTSRASLAAMEWFFEVVFDYGEGHWTAAADDRVLVSATPEATWPVRPDEFSTYRSGFEVRTSRRCGRVLMFHRFPELDPEPTLVRSVELAYDDLAPTTDIARELAHPGSTPARSVLRTVTQRGHVADADALIVRGGARYRTYAAKALPPIALAYSQPAIDDTVRELDPASMRNVVAGVDDDRYRWVDLDGEGLSGILSEQAGAWFYKRNLAGQLGPVELVTRLPPSADLARGQQLLDLGGTGRLDLVQLAGPTPGYCERTPDGTWDRFRAFPSQPSIALRDKTTRMVDLTGDGLADVLVDDDGAFTWYPSLGKDGFARAARVAYAADPELAPRLVLADPAQSVFLADMSGDGLSDLVRIRNGEVCYWPNLGYGRFGARITLAGSPWFDTPERFDPRRIRLADLDGSGTTDLVYLGADGIDLYFNRAGNSLSAPRRLTAPPIDSIATVTLVDLLGTGTACLVWSRPGERPLRYIDLMSSAKPHLLVGMANNLGATVDIEYVPSTRFYLADRAAGWPWATRLAFPVHCVARVTTRDQWRGTALASSYSYHHGYFDGVERELRGFGRVEQIDVETFVTDAAGTLNQPPVKTVTWFDTGAALERESLHVRFAAEYAATGFAEPAVLAAELPDELAPDEWQQALRACKGRMLRRETYELAIDTLQPVRLFTTETRGCAVRRLQARGTGRHAVFLTIDRETVTCHYELDLRTGEPPDPRIAHSVVVATDPFGQPVQTIAIGYPRSRRHVDPALPPGAEDAIAAIQHGAPLVAYTEQRFTAAIDDPDTYRLPAPCEVLTYELTGFAPAGYVTRDVIRVLDLSARYPAQVHPPEVATPVAEIPYHLRPTIGFEKRLVEHVRTLYFADDLAGPRALGEQGPRALVYQTYKLALTDALLAAVFAARITPAIVAALADPTRSGYAADGAGAYWIASGIATPDPAHFYLPTGYVDPFGNPTQIAYAHDLVVVSRTDAVGNATTVDAVDYRVLAAARIRDANDNVTAIAFDVLGLATASAVFAGGDDLTGLVVDPAADRIATFFTAAYAEAEAAALLANATARHLYYLGDRRENDGTTTWGHHPAAAATILREQHRAVQPAGARLQTAFEYSDGTGAVLVKKAKAEPAPGTARLRWIATGRTILNNKGKPVAQYEPYFSSNEHRFEEVAAVGVTSLSYYDALDRLVRREFPDGSYARTVPSPWHVARYDANDTVGEPGNRWYAERTAAGAAPEDKRAAAAAYVHRDTPAVTFLDALGRDVIALQHDRALYPGDPAPTERKTIVITTLDTEGKPLWILDARGNLVVQFVRPTATSFVVCYDIAGNVLFQQSMDAGERFVLNDASGKPLFAWDTNTRAGVVETRLTETRYDAVHRPTATWLAIDGGAAELVEQITYGEGQPNDRARNLRGQVFVHLEPSGQSRVLTYDHAGRALETERKLTADPTTERPDWQTATLDAETFTQIVAYDALGRTRLQLGWHRTAARVAVYEPTYNERGLLASEDLILRATRTAAGYTEGAGSTRTTVIAAIEYEAKGQRQAIRHGNGTRTRMTYDPDTFRLVQLRTTRPNYDPAFPSAVGQFRDANVVQNLYYTYDAVGNVTEIYDDAFRPAFFANQVIDPVARYTHDAQYRLIAASGREHTGAVTPDATEPAPLGGGFPVPANDPADQRNYRQTFRYDDAGNLLEHAHIATTGWTRSFEYAPDSNRIAKSWLGAAAAAATIYAHDRHGNLLNLANVAAAQYLQWDHRDMISVVDRGGGGTVHYQYDAAKQRTRKTAIKAGAKQWERIYLGGTELYRRYAGGAVVEEIESHHVLDGDYRMLLVEDVLASDQAGATLGPFYRYQYSNKLGSSCLELDAAAAVISYEEYHPFGTTAYRAARNQTDAAKRYRFTGMERDEESGLAYHTARYYAPWLARWTSCDPSGIAAGLNAYQAFRGNPVRFLDRDGRFPTAAEMADAWERQSARIRPETGEMAAARYASYTQRAAEWLVDQIPSGNDPAKSMFRDQAVGSITTLKVAADVVGGLAAAANDPDMVVRGIMRLGVGSAQGSVEWEKGDKVGGGSKIAVEALTAVTLVLGGIGAARAATIPKNPNVAGGITNPVNRAFYSGFEGSAAESAEGPLSANARQVTIQPLVEAPAGEIGPRVLPARVRTINGTRQVVTSGGRPLRFRVDSVDRTLGELSFEEAKSTVTAPLTPNQALGFPLLEEVGGIVRAHNAGAVGLTYGTVLGPQGAVAIIRPFTLLMRLLRPGAMAVAGTVPANTNRDAQQRDAHQR